MSIDSEKIEFWASQLALRPDQRRGLHEFLKPYTAKTSAPPAVNAASGQSRRLQRLHAAANDSNSLAIELKHTTMELDRLRIPYSEEAGVNLDKLEAATAQWPVQERIRIKTRLHRVGLLD
jgi:hypothetical protein